MRFCCLIILIIYIFASGISFGQYHKNDIHAISKRDFLIGCILTTEKIVLLKDSTFIQSHSYLSTKELLVNHSNDSLKRNTWSLHNDTLTLYNKINRRGKERIFYTHYIKVKKPSKEIRDKINSDLIYFRRNLFFKWFSVGRKKMVIY